VHVGIKTDVDHTHHCERDESLMIKAVTKFYQRLTNYRSCYLSINSSHRDTKQRKTHLDINICRFMVVRFRQNW
jgi:hypothetical protein